MNDFTEDELNDIWCGLGWLIESEAYHIAHPIIQLRERVKSMIDNYCDHHETIEIQAPSDLCKKCDKVLSKEWI